MSPTLILLHLAGDIALLLWGIHMVHSGVVRAFGSTLRHWLGLGLKRRWRAFLAGAGVTTLLQSSTATAMMATSFTATGVVALVPALAVMLGANVGSTLIVQALSFDITLVYPVLLLAGVAAFRRSRGSRGRDLARVALGLGLILLALQLMLRTLEPLETAPMLRELLSAITADPFLNLGIAAIFAWAAHSSVAAMLFIMSLAGTGAIGPEAALAMVLGANLGSAVNPLFEGGTRDPVRLRLPVGNMINRLVGCAIALPLLQPAAELLARLDPDPARMAANFHTGFNLALAALFALPLPWLARGLARVLPQRVVVGDPSQPQYLDRQALDNPALALANAAREALRMADVVDTMLRGSHDVLHSDDRQRVGEISRMDDILDRLHGAIQRYLAEVSRDGVGEPEAKRVAEILSLAINLEHVGDIIDKSLMELAAKRIKLRLKLSRDGLAEIDEMLDRLSAHLQLAVAVFMLGDVRAARQLVAEKEHFREVERSLARRHFARMTEGETQSLETGGLLMDIVRDLKRIDAHIAATAYPLLEQTGALKPSRLSG